MPPAAARGLGELRAHRVASVADPPTRALGGVSSDPEQLNALANVIYATAALIAVIGGIHFGVRTTTRRTAAPVENSDGPEKPK